MALPLGRRFFERSVLKMEKKISSVLAVLMAVLVLSACEAQPTSSDNLSTEQGDEPSVSKSAAESLADEAELRSAAMEMGYSESRIDEITGYGMALEQLLTPEENDSGGIYPQTSPNGRYTLGGYCFFDGGPGLACAYIKDNRTGKISVFNEAFNGFSSYGFTAEGTVYIFYYSITEGEQSVLNFYAPENTKAPCQSWSPNAEGVLVWNRVDYIPSADALLIFWADVSESFLSENIADTVYPQYKYRAALIHCSDFSVEEIDTGIALATNRYGQIITPELDRRDERCELISFLDNTYKLKLSPFGIE